MDLGLPGADHPTRMAISSWLTEHPSPSGEELARAGYVVPHWPSPYGLGADPIDQLIIDEELRAAHVRRPLNPIGIGWAGPTIALAGTEEQKQRWLWPLLAGTEFWCQLFSEPNAGSDLTALSTRAELDGDHWVVNGSKIWTSFGHVAKWGILLARTDPEAPKHEGISYFICPMDAPGITIRPLIDMTGDHAFNEVFFDDVAIPADHLIGEAHRGWSLAKVTLGNERVSLSGEGSLWGNGPTASDLVDLVRQGGGCHDAAARQRLIDVYIEGEILRVLRLRTVAAVVNRREPGPEASVRKAIADAHGQHVMDLARDLAGAYAMLAGSGPLGLRSSPPGGWPDHTWSHGFLYSPALTVGGGTAEVQRNIVAERVLGLPRDLEGS